MNAFAAAASWAPRLGRDLDIDCLLDFRCDSPVTVSPRSPRGGSRRAGCGHGWYLSPMRDTSPDAANVQTAAFRRLSPAERVALAFEASEWLMTVARTRAAGEAATTPTPAVRAFDTMPAERVQPPR